MEVYINGRRIPIDPRHSIGKGGEADIFDIGGGRALKVFKRADHPDYQGLPLEQKAAEARIAEHQRKLPAFPRTLPPRVVQPLDLAQDAKKRIAGYTMHFLQGAEPLIRYAGRDFREKSGIGPAALADLFSDLHRTLEGVHVAGAVVGDFNPMNVLALGTEAWMIDADSFQFGPFPCRVFTARVLDPLLCTFSAQGGMPVRPFTPESDWYAFTVMLMDCLLYVDPYGGVYRPKDPALRIAHELRPERRITVFHPEVRYPKAAIPYSVLPDDLLQHFHLVFEKDRRGPFPAALLREMRWTKCPACGREHARAACPFCPSAPPPAAVRERTVVRGKLTATRLFRTPGVILEAAGQCGELLWLYHENGYFRRENGSPIREGQPDPRTRFRLLGAETWVGWGNRLLGMAPGKENQSRSVDTCEGRSVFDTSERHLYRADGGYLFRDGPNGAETVGEVLESQTRFWTGRRFGFGFYRAARWNAAFVFDALGRGINDRVPVALQGELVGATCTFSDELCWFFAAVKQGARIRMQCHSIRPDGGLDARAEAEEGDGSWLSASWRGCCAAGRFLFAPSEEGILRLENQGGQISITRQFPDTEPFADSGCRLIPGKDGIYVVRRQEIVYLTL